MGEKEEEIMRAGNEAAAEVFRLQESIKRLKDSCSFYEADGLRVGVMIKDMGHRYDQLYKASERLYEEAKRAYETLWKLAMHDEFDNDKYRDLLLGIASGSMMGLKTELRRYEEEIKHER